MGKNRIVIVMLVIVIIILLSFCFLFVTGVINFNKIENTVDDSIQTSEEDEVDGISGKELDVLNVVKDLFSNEVVQYLVDPIVLTYCDCETTEITSKELGLDYNSLETYNKCTSFTSYEELVNYFKQYVTDDYFESLLAKEKYLNQKFELTDGTIVYNYYEKDGNLYKLNTGKGSNISKIKLLKDEIVYKIDEFNDDIIMATVIAKWEDSLGMDNIQKVKFEIINVDGIWKINSYESSQL